MHAHHSVHLSRAKGLPIHKNVLGAHSAKFRASSKSGDRRWDPCFASCGAFPATQTAPLTRHPQLCIILFFECVYVLLGVPASPARCCLCRSTSFRLPVCHTVLCRLEAPLAHKTAVFDKCNRHKSSMLIKVSIYAVPSGSTFRASSKSGMASTNFCFPSC